MDRSKGLYTAQSVVQHKPDPLAGWGGTRGIHKTVLVEIRVFGNVKICWGFSGHFFATVKLPIPGGGRDLRMSGSYPQGWGPLETAGVR